jgi:hypothetical protein
VELRPCVDVGEKNLSPTHWLEIRTLQSVASGWNEIFRPLSNVRAIKYDSNSLVLLFQWRCALEEILLSGPFRPDCTSKTSHFLLF